MMLMTTKVKKRVRKSSRRTSDFTGNSWYKYISIRAMLLCIIYFTLVMSQFQGENRSFNQIERLPDIHTSGLLCGQTV